MRRAFVSLAVVTGLLGAGCGQVPPPAPVADASEALPVPPAPPRAPPRPRAAVVEAAPAGPEPAGPEPADGHGATAEAEAAPEPSAPAGPEAAPQLQAALPPGLITPPPAVAPPSLAALTGADEGEVLRRFGRPDRVAAVGQGMRWTWDVEGCEMTMTLFPDVAAQRRRVLSAELTGAARSDPGEAACLDRLGRRRAGL